MNLSHWPRASLVSLCKSGDDIKCGPFGTQLSKDEFRDEGIPLWGIKHVNAGFKIPTKDFLEPRTAKALEQYDLRPGDIVMTRKGTVGNCAVYPATLPRGIMHSDLLRLRLDTARCESEFLVHQLHHSPDVERQLLLISGGAIMPGINVGRLKHLEVFVPPRSEQKRIAEILDRAEALRAKRRAALAQLDSLTQSIFLEMFGDHRRATQETVLSACAEVVSGIAKGRNLAERKTVVVPYLRVANVQAGYLNLDEIKTIEALPNEVEELALKSGDLVLTEGGDFDKLGRGAMWSGEVTPCIHQNHVFRVRVNSNILTPEFFHHYLQTPRARAYFLRCAKRTTNLASINMSQLRALPVATPPLTLQHEFACRATAVEKLKLAHRRSLAELDALFASLQHRAFRGEL